MQLIKHAIKLSIYLLLIFRIEYIKCSDENILRILAYPGYADQDWVIEFEKLTHSKVKVTIIDSDDALWEKLNTNKGNDYDIFSANTAELVRYIDNGIASPINLEKISNIKNQIKRFKDLEKSNEIMRNKKTYAIPFTYSEMGLIYDKSQIETPPKSMNEFWNPKFKNKILLYDGTVHNFSFTALVLGIQNPFKLTDSDFIKVVDKLVLLRNNGPRFYVSPEQGTKEFIDNKMALMYGNFGSQQVKKLRDAGANIGYIIPAEGALAWLDCWIISSATKNTSLAEKWINYTLTRKISDELFKRQNLANTLSKTSFSTNDKIVWLGPVENNDKRTKSWDRIRKDKARLQEK